MHLVVDGDAPRLLEPVLRFECRDLGGLGCLRCLRCLWMLARPLLVFSWRSLRWLSFLAKRRNLLSMTRICCEQLGKECESGSVWSGLKFRDFRHRDLLSEELKTKTTDGVHQAVYEKVCFSQSPLPARACLNAAVHRARGNDGRWYVIKVAKNGVPRWVPAYKRASPKKR